MFNGRIINVVLVEQGNIITTVVVDVDQRIRPLTANIEQLK
jgi:hypothetical protein